MKKAFVVIVPLALLVLGVALIVSSTMANKEASRTSHWTQAAGTIDRVAGTKSGEASASYELDGREYRNEHLSFRDLREPYRTGQSVIVYVNPANPNESVLQHAPLPSPWLVAGGAFSALLGGVLAFYFRRQTTARVRRQPLRRKGGAPMSRLRPPAPIKRNDGESE